LFNVFIGFKFFLIEELILFEFKVFHVLCSFIKAQLFISDMGFEIFTEFFLVKKKSPFHVRFWFE